MPWAIASSGPGAIKLIVLVAIPVAGLVLRFALGRPPWWMQRARATSAGRRAPGLGERRAIRGEQQRALVVRMLVSAAGPWVVYTLLRSYVGTDAEALAISGAIPAAWVLIVLAWKRRVDLIALASVGLFALAIVLSLISGGSSLPLKIRGAAVTGVLGLACVVSVVAGKPLPLLVLQLRARRAPEAARLLQRARGDPARRHAITDLTTLIGITLLAAAAVRVILAVTLSTTAFLSVSSATQWAIIAAGGLPILWYVHRCRRSASREGGEGSDREDPAARPVPGLPLHRHR